MNKTRRKRYWTILVLFILIFTLLVLRHQMAAAKMIANSPSALSLTLDRMTQAVKPFYKVSKRPCI